VKRFPKSRLVKAVAVVIIAGSAGAWVMAAVRAKAHDEHEVAKMTEKMKTVCVGRFLIDLPEEARVALTEPRIDGFDIETLVGETNEEFWTRVARREANIRTTPDRLGGNKNLESVRDVKTDSGLVGKIFVHSRKVTEGTAAKGLELEHYRYEGVAVEALVRANGVTIALSADNYDPRLIENMPKLVSKLVANPDNRIPSEPGYCIDLAYVRDPLTAKQGEQIMMMANLPSHPDIEFRLMLSAGNKPADQGLLERGAESDARMSLDERMRISKLRAAPRTIAGLTGDELVVRFDEENNSIVYSFWWEVNGTADNVFVPHFSFMMDTGKGNHQPVPSSLSEGAAMGLWDKITSSIRVRPTRSPKASVAPQTVPIGSVASAGQICPQSGWWLCADGGGGVGVLGGQRQYIRQGERMPQALLLPSPTLWEKVRRLQPSYEAKAPTSWKLVDKRSRNRVAPSVPLAQAVAAQGAIPKRAGAGTEESQAAVGTYATTGKACPASGWWRCEEPSALDGTRWFAKGSLLPAATFAVPPGVFGKSSGAPKAIQRRGTWQLVRLAEAPGPVDARDDGATSNQSDADS
jgi:hypothetical protein